MVKMQTSNLGISTLEQERRNKQSAFAKGEHSGAMTVKEFLDWARISRTTFYKEVNAGRIQLKKVGKRSLVRRADAEAWLDSLPCAA